MAQRLRDGQLLETCEGYVWQDNGAGIGQAIIGVFSGAFKLAPLLIIALPTTALIIFATLFLSLSAMVVVVSLVVLATSYLVYAITQDYREAAFQFVGGMLAAFAVLWTPGSVVAFLAALVGFNLLVFFTSAIRLAAELETIYTNAAGIRGGDTASIKSLAKRLQSIGDAGTQNGLLSPIERARVIRLLVFRQIDLDVIRQALTPRESVKASTLADLTRVTNFVADLMKLAERETSRGRTGDMQESFHSYSKVPFLLMMFSDDVFAAFEKSRSLVLSGRMGVSQYFEKLKKALENGISADEMKDELGRNGP